MLSAIQSPGSMFVAVLAAAGAVGADVAGRRPGLLLGELDLLALELEDVLRDRGQRGHRALCVVGEGGADAAGQVAAVEASSASVCSTPVQPVWLLSSACPCVSWTRTNVTVTRAHSAGVSIGPSSGSEPVTVNGMF